MNANELQPIADAVLRLAKQQGHITGRDVRAELRIAGLDETAWKEAIALVQSSLVHRQGRYYHKEAFNPRVQKKQAQEVIIQKAIRRLIKQHRTRTKNERRSHGRIDFIQPVKVRTEDGREFTLMSRDLSATGVRLLGTRRLLGQKVQIEFPSGEGEPTCCISVRILWTCAVGDDLFENGGSFLELIES